MTIPSSLKYEEEDLGGSYCNVDFHKGVRQEHPLRALVPGSAIYRKCDLTPIFSRTSSITFSAIALHRLAPDLRTSTIT